MRSDARPAQSVRRRARAVPRSRPRSRPSTRPSSRPSSRAPAARARSPGLELVHVRGSDPPLGAVLGAVEPPGAQVAVGRHVVDAQPLGHLGEGQELGRGPRFGHQVRRARSSTVIAWVSAADASSMPCVRGAQLVPGRPARDHGQRVEGDGPLVVGELGDLGGEGLLELEVGRGRAPGAGLLQRARPVLVDHGGSAHRRLPLVDAGPLLDERGQPLVVGQVGGHRDVPLEQALELDARGLLVERFEVTEVVVDQPQRDAGPLGDPVRGRLEVALVDEAEERLGDRRPSPLGAGRSGLGTGDGHGCILPPDSSSPCNPSRHDRPLTSPSGAAAGSGFRGAA